MNPEYILFADRLTKSLKLRQPPISISFAQTVPEGVGSFEGNAPAGCRFWQEAATKVFTTSAADHSLCAIGVYTHHLQTSPAQRTDLQDALKVFSDLEYVRGEDLPLIPVLETNPGHVIYGPLADMPLRPSVVLLFVDASQTLILSEATQQIESQNPPAMGRPACAVVPQVINTGRAALSLGCCGARAYLDELTDGVALFAIPGMKLAAYTERIEALSGANATLTQFHNLRRRDIEAGAKPTIKESLAVLAGAGV